MLSKKNKGISFMKVMKKVIIIISLSLTVQTCILGSSGKLRIPALAQLKNSRISKARLSRGCGCQKPPVQPQQESLPSQPSNTNKSYAYRSCNYQRSPAQSPSTLETSETSMMQNSDEMEQASNKDGQRGCGCQRPPVQPKPAPSPETVVQNQTDSHGTVETAVQSTNEMTIQDLVKECCALLMEEAQKLSDASLAQEIMATVAMVQAQEEAENKNQLINEDTPDSQDCSSQVMLAECCVALLDESKKNCDTMVQEKVEEIIEKLISCIAE